MVIIHQMVEQKSKCHYIHLKLKQNIRTHYLILLMVSSLLLYAGVRLAAECVSYLFSKSFTSI